jgi:hypothetical protein
MQERDSANKEAHTFQSELQASLSKNTNNKDTNNDGRCFFVLKARLGGASSNLENFPMTTIIIIVSITRLPTNNPNPLHPSTPSPRPMYWP